MSALPGQPSLRGIGGRHAGAKSAWKRGALAAAVASALLLAPSRAMSQPPGNPYTVVGANLQKYVNGVLALMQYSITPEVAASSLSIRGAQTGNTGFAMTQFGGGFTVSRSFPLYLEGNASLSRFDPTFVASNGTEERQLPVKWNILVGSAGVGWDFPITPELVIRPIANFTLGHLESDLSLLEHILEGETGLDIEFLERGRLNAMGYGGSLMLDFERHRHTHEIDVEARVTSVYLQNIGGTSEAVKGSALAQSAGLWTRWRAPIGVQALHRPLRYVLEYAYTYYFGPDGDILGFNHLNSVGAGIELDTSAYDTIATRWRLIGRYRFGQNVTGWSFGLGISF